MIDTNSLSVSQESEELPCEFDVLEFELEREELYRKAQSTYIEYEIDSIEDEFGNLYRVWDRRTLVGTFYKAGRGWKVTPFYLCRKYIKADIDFSQNLDNVERAIAYIKSMYEGKGQNKGHLAAA